jgi:excisionase family DNA binding protein
MTRQRLPLNAARATQVRRGRGLGEPAPHPVPPSSGVFEPLLLDSREVARLLRVGRTKAFQLMARGEVPVVRIGRNVRVPRTHLEMWIAERTAMPIRGEASASQKANIRWGASRV